jgi:CBS domain-containing protein
MPISDICTTPVVTAARDTSILEVARLMRERHVGCVVVVDEVKGKTVPVGLITDRDLALEVIAVEADPLKLSAADIVIHNVIVADEDDGILETLHSMRKHGVRRLPVLNRDGALVGIVSADDLIGLIAEEMKELAKMIAVEQHHEKTLLRMSYAAGPGLSGTFPL